MEVKLKNVVKGVVSAQMAEEVERYYLSSYLYKREIYIISLISLFSGF